MLRPFVIAHFLSAFLLFLIEPMYAKRVLPLLGGSAEVWTTCMLFYQSLLLAGYAYAHLITDRWRWSLRKQMVVQGILLLVSFAFWLIGPPDWPPPLGCNPIGWLLSYLLISAGPAFFVLSTTTPLLQRWIAMTRDKWSLDPYFLYSASNLGSMIALLSYPSVFEPLLTLSVQHQVWCVGYFVLMIIMGLCARTILASNPSVIVEESEGTSDNAIDWKQRVHWILLAFIPASLMLSVTTYLTTNIAPFPLLWIVPLVLYLLSLIIVFSRTPILKREWMINLQPLIVAILAIVFYLEQVHYEYKWMFPLNLLAFFLAAMVCHGELARSRPSVRHLTEFYLLMAVGGALGACFNALIAPYLFNSVQEYPLILALSLMLRPQSKSHEGERRPWLDFVLPAAILVLMMGLRYAVKNMPNQFGVNDQPIVLIPGALLALCLWRRPIALSLSIGAVLFVGATYWPRDYIFQGRNFFGAIRVERIDSFNLLSHGDILHGGEKRDGQRPHEPLTYFHLGSPIGQFFSAYNGKLAHANIAVVGLGAGTLAFYGQPGQHWTFYEIDPQILQVAMDPLCFTYLSDCQSHIDAVIGDGRLGLLRAPDNHYGVIVFDAFSSDAIPVHMLTREAMRMYLSKLTPDGVLAFHISTRCVDLKPILRALADDAKLSCAIEQQPALSQKDIDAHKSDSTWVFIARKAADLDLLKNTADYRGLSTEPPGVSVWTDDFSNMLESLRFN